MARFYRRRNYGGKKKKWRQQKLAIGTVQKIARVIAKQEDNKKMEWRVHQMTIVQTGETWISQTSRPVEASKRRYVPGETAAWLMSGFGNAVENDLVDNAASPQNRSAVYGVKTVQAHVCFENNTPLPIKAIMAIFYLPNLDGLTADAVDRLLPRIEFFRGTPNLRFDGIFGGYLQKMSDPNRASARTVVICAQKKFTINPGTAYQGEANYFTQPCKGVHLSRTYKRLKKLYYNFSASGSDANNRAYLTNGNFYLAICADTIIDSAVGEAGLKMWGVAGCKYVRLKPGIKDTGV